MGFSLFGPYHIGWFIFITISVVLISKHFKQLNTKKQRAFQQKLAWFILLAETSKITYLIVRNEFTIHYLPLELCSFAILAIFLHSYTNSPMIGETLYNLFLPGAIAALMFCNWTHRQIYEFMCLIGRKRGALISGGEIDLERTSGIILDDFRSGKTGKITLEVV